MVLSLHYIPIYQTDKLDREVIETFRKLLGRQRVSGAHSIAPVGGFFINILLQQIAVNPVRDV